jgi:hypothetical protein
VLRNVNVLAVVQGTCEGKVSIKLFACAVHPKCTLARALEGIASCQKCGDYRSTAVTS